MTNEQIIFNAAVQSGIFSEAEAMAYLKAGRRLPLHTYTEWKRLGYQVKRGEKAAIQLTLWKYGKSKPADENKAEEADEHCYMQSAYLFTISQVERREERHIKTAEEIKAYNAMLKEQRKARA